jgi:hypothetical protein
MNNYEHRDNNDRNNFRDNDDRTQLFVAKGRNDGMSHQALVDFIADETKIDPTLISNVKVLDAFSFFAVPHEDAEMILDFFQEKAGERRPIVSRAKRKNSEDRNSGGQREYRGESRGGYRNDDRRDRGGYNDRNGGDRNNSERSNRNRDYGNRSYD